MKKGGTSKNAVCGSFRSGQERRVESIGSNSEPFPKCLKPRKISGGRADKVYWTRENEAQFVVLCHQEYLNGQLLTTCFSRPTLSQIGDRLNSLVDGNVKYGLPHLRTKWKNVKRAWKLLYDLRFKRGSGLGWDPEKETIVGTVEQLEAIYAEHRDNKSIIKRGLPHFDLCSEMFNKKVATGNHTRSSMQPSNESGAPEDETFDSTPPSLDTSAPSQSEYNFTPELSSQDIPESSNRGRRKRTSSSSDRDALLVQTLTNFGAYITEKRTQASREREEYNTCLGILHAMEDIPPRIQAKAGERLSAAFTRQMFLLYDEYQRRNWLMSLCNI
ncbi:hypothetical protein ACS0TY_018773 [Phlomoides rotata]